jgi:hypothetical protein
VLPSAWGGAVCKYNGIHVVDIANPAAPREVAFIPSKEGSYAGEGVQSIRLTTPQFSGDIVVSNSEICKGKAGFGGINIHDVTRPSSPTPLAVGIGDTTLNGQGKKGANENHSVFAWDAGDKGYLVSVDNEEAADVDIFDITDPKAPKLVAEHDLLKLFPQIAQAAPVNLQEIFLHDMVVKAFGDRQVMLLSYWDGGYIKLDVTDVRNPKYLADSDFADIDQEAAASGFQVPPEGNAHQAEFTADNKYIIAADEDFAPYALVAKNVDDDTVLNASQGSGTRPLKTGETITGASVFVGRACDADPAFPAGGAGTQIAVVERGVCPFTEKVGNVIDAGGYEAVLIFNRTASDGCSTPLTMSVEGDIPAFGVAPRQQGFAIFDQEAKYDEATCRAGDGTQLAPIAIGTVGDTLTFSSYFDGWGYGRLYENGDGKLKEVDQYAVAQAHDPAFASGFGDLSIHEVATSPTKAGLAYFAYYAAGFRVAKVANGQITEVGHFIDAQKSNFWGVEVFQDGGKEYVAASDRDKGLYIFRYTGK